MEEKEFIPVQDMIFEIRGQKVIQGVSMLSSVIHSEQAIKVNIEIIKALNNLIEKPKPTGKIGFNPD